MATRTLFSIIESPAHPDFARLYARLAIQEVKFNSMRKAISRLKRERPDFVLAEFFYGYGNNYAGVNVSNLDVLLYSLQRYAPDARVLVMVDKAERPYVAKLEALFDLYAVLEHPVRERRVEALLAEAPATEQPSALR